ncbi:MAG: glgX1 [Proteobacteria bacterium]|nr:glgX1 [Pseudomonadota bacterium]
MDATVSSAPGAAATPMTRGLPAPLGARWTGEGVNFAVFSAHAERIEVCLFDAVSGRETGRHALPARTGMVWHGFLPAALAAPGTLYGFRAHGPFSLRDGHRFNPERLLVDPAARALEGPLRSSPLLDDDPECGPRAGDTASCMPRSCVVDLAFDWQGVRAPAVPWRDTVLYELHVRGFTQRHPDVPPEWRGRYLGLTVPSVIAHLRSLGVTSVELLPCQAFVSEPFLLERGLKNYWGYNPLAWFAPAPQYAVRDAVGEFRQMVRALHAGGIEVILDVVFNHTAESGAGGRTLSMKGLDNASYYRLAPGDARMYENHSGCGNTVNATHPAVRELILECLRHWAREMGVDGFRFDLATALARGHAGFDPHAAIFGAIRSDPILSYVKLIAEPWDLGPGGYHLGGFPAGWSEWNDRYRDTVRAFWRGDPGRVPALAERLAGSSDLFRAGGRRPQASINYVTSHDGYTLADLVSYAHRHNAANLEGNRDGHGDNLSCNHGVEGPSDDPAVVESRARHMRNLLATLWLSQGVPMLQAGDELARSQGGNNNAYCQDNETSWLDWDPAAAPQGHDNCGFIRSLAALRLRRPELRRDTFFKGSPREGRQPDVRWLHPAGRDMLGDDWADEGLRCLGVLLGAAEDQPGDLMVVLHAGIEDIEFRLPGDVPGRWRACLDTASPGQPADGPATEHPMRLRGRSLVVLERIG